MGYFPMCISLKDSHILLIGEGKSATEKLHVLQPFGTEIRILSTLTEQDLDPRPAFVVVCDTDHSEKERISILCKQKNIPVNVVDVPTLCSFYFPAIIQNGDLTVSVSTGGKSPGAAAYLRHHLEPHIPDRTDEILEWLADLRKALPKELVPEKRRMVLKQAVADAFEKNRPLENHELLKFDISEK